jgi:hypothetical protein
MTTTHVSTTTIVSTPTSTGSTTTIVSTPSTTTTEYCVHIELMSDNVGSLDGNIGYFSINIF